MGGGRTFAEDELHWLLAGQLASWLVGLDGESRYPVVAIVGLVGRYVQVLQVDACKVILRASVLVEAPCDLKRDREMMCMLVDT